MKLDCVYVIEFWDHTLGFKKPIKAKVVGWVSEHEKEYVSIQSWQNQSVDTTDKYDDDNKICILKCAIIKKTLLK